MDLDERQWLQAGDEAVEHLARLNRFDTTNPPGNETPAALYLKQVLERAGLAELQLLEAAPRRGNLVARLRGDGSRPPLLLSAHLDVAPAGPERRSQPPFGGAGAGGLTWGRGAPGMKQMAALSLAVMLLARSQELPLRRDLIFAAVADGEMGMDHGSRWLVENHPDLVRAEYGLTGLCGAPAPLLGRRCYPIPVAEKGACRLRLRAAGLRRGATPRAVARAVARLQKGAGMPMHVTPAAAGFVRALAAGQPPLREALLRGLLIPPLAPMLLPWLPDEVRGLLRAMLTNTAALASPGVEGTAPVSPGEPEAEVHCRLLPGQTAADVVRDLRRLVGPGIEIEPAEMQPGVEFRTDTALYRLLEQTLIAHDPEATPVPLLLSGSTDACQYARLGVTVYGFTFGPAHGHEERTLAASLRSGLRVLWDVVSRFCT